MATDDDAYDHDHADYHADDNDGHAEEQGRGRLHDGDMKRKLEVQAGTIAAFMKPSFWVVLLPEPLSSMIASQDLFFSLASSVAPDRQRITSIPTQSTPECLI